jgi:Tetratricopeptide repeat.
MRSTVWAKEIGDLCGEGQALSNLGNAYFRLGKTGQAIECYQQSLEVSRKVGKRLAGWALRSPTADVRMATQHG